jgi:hypothetical protein
MRVFEDLNTNPSRRDLRSLGITLLVGLGAVGALFYFRFDNPSAGRGLWIGAVCGLIVSLLPVLGRWLYIGWMGLGMAIGLVTSPIVLMVLYLVVFVPLGLVFRLIKRDTMRRSFDGTAATYWEDYPKNEGPQSYLKRY